MWRQIKSRTLFETEDTYHQPPTSSSSRSRVCPSLIAQQNNNARTFFDDVLVDFMFSDSVAEFNFAKNLAWIPAYFDNLFFEVNRPLWTDDDTITFLTLEVQHSRTYIVAKSIQSIDLKRASGVIQIVMPINLGNHWTAATLFFGERTTVSSIEFKDSSEATGHLRTVPQDYFGLFVMLERKHRVDRGWAGYLSRSLRMTGLHSQPVL